MLAGKEAKQVQWTNVYEDALVSSLGEERVGLATFFHGCAHKVKSLEGPLTGVNQTEEQEKWPAPQPLHLSPGSEHLGWGHGWPQDTNPSSSSPFRVWDWW